jgi:hypothetical protein
VERIRIATIIFCILLIVQIIRAVRREHIRVEISMGWFAAALLLLALGVSDRALNWVSDLLGLRGSAFILLTVAGLLFLFTFFRFSIEVSTLKDHSIVLAQKVGLLEWEVRRQRDEIAKLRGESGEEEEEAEETVRVTGSSR